MRAGRKLVSIEGCITNEAMAASGRRADYEGIPKRGTSPNSTLCKSEPRTLPEKSRNAKVALESSMISGYAMYFRIPLRSVFRRAELHTLTIMFPRNAFHNIFRKRTKESKELSHSYSSGDDDLSHESILQWEPCV